MKFRTTLWLFVGVCALATLALLIHQRGDAGRKDTPQHVRVTTFLAEDLQQLHLVREGLDVQCVRRDGVWTLERPIRARADEGRLQRIVNALEALTRVEVITAEECRERELELKDYGLSEPRIRLAGVSRGGGRLELLVGDPAPLGDLVYLKLSGSDEIIATQRGLVDTLPVALEELRDRGVLRGMAGTTTRLEIHRPGSGFIQLAQSGGRWLIQQPVFARADAGKLTAMLDAVYGLTVSRFVWDPLVESTNEVSLGVAAAAATPRAELYGLAPDEAAARIGVWVYGDEVGQELILGKEAEGEGKEIFARRGGENSVFTVGCGVLDRFAVTVSALRDHTVFPLDAAAVRYVCLKQGDQRLVLERRDREGWVLTEPASWRADDRVVAALLGKLTGLMAEEFLDGATNVPPEAGFAPPAYSVQLAARKPAPAAGTAAAPGPGGAGDPAWMAPVVWIAEPAAEGTSTWARTENDPVLFRIPAGVIRELGPHLADPLVYRDRTMLALSSDTIRRVTVLVGEREESLERGTNGLWRVLVPTGQVANVNGIEDLLFSVENLRALRIESQEPKSLAACGLDKPAAVLTLGLTGEGGIQKSILFGFRAKTDGVYAMVQGQDVVFVMERAMMDRLILPLVMAPPHTASP